MYNRNNNTSSLSTSTILVSIFFIVSLSSSSSSTYRWWLSSFTDVVQPEMKCYWCVSSWMYSNVQLVRNIVENNQYSRQQRNQVQRQQQRLIGQKLFTGTNVVSVTNRNSDYYIHQSTKQVQNNNQKLLYTSVPYKRSFLVMMPEGPEVKLYVDQIRTGAIGKRLLDVEFVSGRYVRNGPHESFYDFAPTMTRYNKHIINELENTTTDTTSSIANNKNKDNNNNNSVATQQSTNVVIPQPSTMTRINITQPSEIYKFTNATTINPSTTETNSAATSTSSTASIDDNDLEDDNVDIIVDWNCKGKFMYFVLDNDVPHNTSTNKNWNGIENDNVTTKMNHDHIVVDPDYRRSVWITLGMTGRLISEHEYRTGETKHIRWILKLLDIKTKKLYSIYYQDVREFGTLRFCISKKELEYKITTQLGYDILNRTSTTADAFVSLVTKYQNLYIDNPRKQINICKFCMDQSKIAGIGNYILAEGLYRATIDPFCTLNELNDKQQRVLFHELQAVAIESYTSLRKEVGFVVDTGADAGNSNDHLDDDDIDIGDFEMQCYGRQFCKQRNEPVMRDTNGPHGRTIWYTERQLFMPREERIKQQQQQQELELELDQEQELEMDTESTNSNLLLHEPITEPEAKTTVALSEPEQTMEKSSFGRSAVADTKKETKTKSLTTTKKALTTKTKRKRTLIANNNEVIETETFSTTSIITSTDNAGIGKPLSPPSPPPPPPLSPPKFAKMITLDNLSTIIPPPPPSKKMTSNTTMGSPSDMTTQLPITDDDDDDDDNISSNTVQDDQSMIDKAVTALTSTITDPVWYDALKNEFQKDYFRNLIKFLIQEDQQEQHIVYPPRDQVFTALNLCPLETIKVVIVGQDPYHGPNQAHGLAFSVYETIRPPPSLINIIREVIDDIGIESPNHGNLESWSKQGVLLLNTVLTVREGEPNSHSNKGWEQFTDAILRAVHDYHKNTGIVYMLWGNSAAAKVTSVIQQQPKDDVTVMAKKRNGSNSSSSSSSSGHPFVTIIQTSHPSPLGATKTRSPFLGSKCFSRANRAIRTYGKDPIDWSLPERDDF